MNSKRFPDATIWQPLLLHRSPLDGEQGDIVTQGLLVMRLKCIAVPHEDYPFFECKKALKDVPLEELQSFCEFWDLQIEDSHEGSVNAILQWQESVLEKVGFVIRSRNTMILLFDWSKAIPRRGTYEIDKARLLDYTGYTHIDEAMANLSSFIKTPAGYAHVLTVYLYGGWGQPTGKIITGGWEIYSSAADKDEDDLLFIQPAKHIEREDFIKKLESPDLLLWMGWEEVSTALFEYRKYEWVLNTAIADLNQYGSDQYWSIVSRTRRDEFGFQPSEPIELLIPEAIGEEQVQLICTRHEIEIWVEYAMPLSIAPLFLLAAVKGFRKTLLAEDRKCSNPILTSKEIYPYSNDQEILQMLNRWIEHLEKIAIYDDRLLQQLQKLSSNHLLKVMVPELEELLNEQRS